ncbi:MAG: hypothetical protein ABIF77_11775, partial [bacterium]
TDQVKPVRRDGQLPSTPAYRPPSKIIPVWTQAAAFRAEKTIERASTGVSMIRRELEIDFGYKGDTIPAGHPSS